MGNLERFAVLHIIDERWREHLREMDELKEGIFLRAYGQRDPVVEYKKEAFEIFSRMIKEIDVEVMSFVFRYVPEVRAPRQTESVRTNPANEQRPVGDGLPRERSSTSSTRRLRFTHASTSGMGLGTDPEMAAALGTNPQQQENTASASDAEVELPRTVTRDNPKVGRNDPCYCGSGKKFKHCHGAR